MSEPDRLAEVDACQSWHDCDCRVLLRAEVWHLRGLLKRLEWAGTHCERGPETAACPVCGVVADSPVVGQQPHAADCWLAAEIAKRPAPAPPES